MNPYRNKQLPASSMNIFTDLISTEDLQTRHIDYNYQNKPAVKRLLESFPLKCLIRKWNSLNIDIKSSPDKIEFETIVKEHLLSKYNIEPQCDNVECYSCN